MASFTPQSISWTSSAYDFIYTYDWDTLILNGNSAFFLSFPIQLCTGLFPCALNLQGQGNLIQRTGTGSVSCWSSNGCIGIFLQEVKLRCENSTFSSPIFKVYGSSFVANQSTFSSCSSSIDGSVIQSFNKAQVLIFNSEFENLYTVGSGGVISAVGSHVNIAGSKFFNCSVDMSGGAIFASSFQSSGSEQAVDTNVEIQSSSFVSCMAKVSGGAVHAASLPTALPAPVSIKTSNSSFLSCSSATGGAVYITGAYAKAVLLASNYSFCTARLTGGALSASDSSSLISDSLILGRNSAQGAGGGAIYLNNAIISPQNITCFGNSAPSGGGGALYWEGILPPNVKQETICPATNMAENYAVYGSCIASNFKALRAASLISSGSAALFPGIAYPFSVMKLDFYGQVIATDDTSLLQVLVAADSTLRGDPSVLILGQSIVRMSQGLANLSIALEPSFRVVDCQLGVAQVTHAPLIYFAGEDSEASIASTMNSALLQLSLAAGSAVCPAGYILGMDRASSVSMGLPRKGACSICKAGTYSVNPLKGLTNSDPSCLNCPLGGDCSKGGNNVVFSIGQWIISDGMYQLVECPNGYQLVNYAVLGTFSHDNQRCLACSAGEYILNTSNPGVTCQPCPIGAICNGDSLIGLVNDSTWQADPRSGQYILKACPPGYELLNLGATGQFAYTSQQCRLCLAGYYCPGGISSATVCPQGQYATPGAASLNSCEPAVFVNILVTMPLLKPQFTASKQNDFAEALAKTASVSSARVAIVSVSQNRRRSSDIPSISIVSQVALEQSDQALALIKSFDPAKLNFELAQAGLPSSSLESIAVQVQGKESSGSDSRTTVIAAVVPSASVTIIFLVLLLIYRNRKAPASRRLMGAKPGDKAEQKDLPYELRRKYEAVKVLGSGGFGVVLEVWHLNSGGRRSVRRAIKLVHSTHKRFTAQEIRRLDREVIPMISLMLSKKFIEIV